MTLIARWYVATWGGPVNTVMVNVKLFPEDERKTQRFNVMITCRFEKVMRDPKV